MPATLRRSVLENLDDCNHSDSAMTIHSSPDHGKGMSRSSPSSSDSSVGQVDVEVFPTALFTGVGSLVRHVEASSEYLRDFMS